MRTVLAPYGHEWPHAPRRAWSCATNDYGWRCAREGSCLRPHWIHDAKMQGWVRVEKLRRAGVRFCVVDTARPGTHCVDAGDACSNRI